MWRTWLFHSLSDPLPGTQSSTSVSFSCVLSFSVVTGVAPYCTPSTTAIEEPSYVLGDTGEQKHLSLGITDVFVSAKETQLHLDGNCPSLPISQPDTGCFSSAPWQLREEGGTGPNAEPVLNEQMASSSAPRPPSTHTCPP